MNGLYLKVIDTGSSMISNTTAEYINNKGYQFCYMSELYNLYKNNRLSG